MSGELERGAPVVGSPGYVPVSRVWAHREPWLAPLHEPGVRVVSSTERPEDFMLQIRAMGEVVTVQLSEDVVAELHRQAMTARRTS